MALITSSSDPILWGTLNSSYQENTDVKWVMSGAEHYRVVQKTDGSIAFNHIEQRELFDSRSFTRSRQTRYSNLDG